MIEIRAGRTRDASINLTPLVDVVFLLLIFFLLTAFFIQPEGVGVKLPEAEGTPSQARDEIVVVVDAAGKVLLSDIEVSLDELESQVKSAAHHLKVAKARFEAGTGLRIDVIRAETDLDKARQELLSSHLALDNARDALGMLTGVGGLPMPVRGVDLVAPRDEEQAMVKRALENREDIKAKQSMVELLEKQLDASWMQFLPKLDAAWQLNYQFTQPGDLGSQDRSRWAALLTLTVPIYNQFRYADLDHKRASLRQTMIQEQDLKQNTAMNVRLARRDYLTARLSEGIAERQTKLAAEALALAEAAYGAGTSSSLEVTDARRTASAADVNLASQRLRAQIAILKLLRAMGDSMLDLPDCKRSGTENNGETTHK